MSDRSLLARYTGRPGDGITSNPEVESDDCGPFGWLRGSQRERAVMLELRKKDGNILALGYAWLERAEFDPSDGITLHFAGRTVRITGSNLNAEVRPGVRLFEGITRHRVVWIQGTAECRVQSETREIKVDCVQW